jgi:hypothetical protein
MKALLATEWLKLRKTKILPFLLLGPVLVFVIALNVDVSAPELKGLKYIYVLLNANLAYAVLILPLMVGVLSTLICRYEHQAGGWKQLFALPTTRGRVYISKFIIVSLLVLAMQLLVLVALLIVGMMKQYGESIPLELLLRGIVGGWIATQPLIALMLWLSTLFQSLGAPFAVNVIFTIPTIMVLNSKYAPYYPWSQPFLMMNVYGEADSGFFYAPLGQLSLVLGVSFLLFAMIGYLYLQRKEV